jgi:hypothetical protein
MHLKTQRKNSTALHEANYAKLMRVVPPLRYLSTPSRMEARGHAQVLLLNVLEKTRYTTVIALGLQHATSTPWLSSQTLSVRIYHDARVAEVTGFQQHRHFTSNYEYPNPDMFHKNEKQQLNKFLGEWLDHCLRSRCIFSNNTESLDA